MRARRVLDFCMPVDRDDREERQVRLDWMMTIEATVVHSTASADDRDLVRMDRKRETIG